MFSTILSEVTKNFDKRFLTSVFFPTLLFLGASIYLLVSDVIKAWKDQSDEIQIVWIIVFLFIATFLAYILDGHRTYILRLYEGDWEDFPIIGKILSKKKKQHQIILELYDLQAALANKEDERLSIWKDAICLKKGIENCDLDLHYLNMATEYLNRAKEKVGELESDKSKLNENSAKSELSKADIELNKAQKDLHSLLWPGLSETNNIKDHLNSAKRLLKATNIFLNNVKFIIIFPHYKKMIRAARNARLRLTLSEKAIDDLMTDLAKKSGSNTLQKTLFIN